MLSILYVFELNWSVQHHHHQPIVKTTTTSTRPSTINGERKKEFKIKKNPNKLNEAISWNVIETTQDKDIHKCVSVAEILLKKKTCKLKEGR